MDEGKKELSKFKLLCIFSAMMLLQLAGLYLAALDVVPSYQAIKFSLAASLHLLAFFLFGFSLYRAVFRFRYGRLPRVIMACLIGAVLVFNAWLTIMSSEGDTREGFVALGGRYLIKEVEYTDAAKTFYVYEWSQIPDGYMGTEVKLREGLSPFAHSLGRFWNHFGEVLRSGDEVDFKEEHSTRTVFRYDLRTGEVWPGPQARAVAPGDKR